jgi:hypothetical protein
MDNFIYLKNVQFPTLCDMIFSNCDWVSTRCEWSVNFYTKKETLYIWRKTIHKIIQKHSSNYSALILEKYGFRDLSVEWCYMFISLKYSYIKLTFVSHKSMSGNKLWETERALNYCTRCTNFSHCSVSCGIPRYSSSVRWVMERTLPCLYVRRVSFIILNPLQDVLCQFRGI